MFESLNQEIMTLREELRNKKRLLDRVQHLDKGIENQTNKLYELEHEMEMEKADVEELENLTVTKLVATLLRNKESKLEKEKREYIVAKLKYEECLSLVEALRGEKAHINEALIKLQHVEDKYKGILKQKEKILLESNNSHKLRIVEISEEMGNLRADKKEIEEAMAIGNKINNKVNELVSNLDSADGWATWDMLGGGIISTSIKHDYIDSAKVFADYFFDGFFVDWMVKSKIEDSYDSAVKLSKNVEQVMEVLKKSMKAVESKIKLLESEKNNLLEQIG
jgi:hypothetical protein